MQIKVMQVGQLGTNCYLLEDEETRTAAVVDPGGEGARILAQLKADGMELKLILLTHAHFDHTGGVAELCAALGAGVSPPGRRGPGGGRRVPRRRRGDDALSGRGRGEAGEDGY